LTLSIPRTFRARGIITFFAIRLDIGRQVVLSGGGSGRYTQHDKNDLERPRLFHKTYLADNPHLSYKFSRF
jgi:hypothetical protein